MDVLAYARPMPPENVRTAGMAFVRALELEDFVRAEFLGRGGLFFDAEHGHLVGVHVGFLWAASRHVDRGQAKAGTAQLVASSEPGKWGAAMQRVLLHQLFGPVLPTFYITLSAPVCWSYDDRQFFGLVDHELSHCAQARDRFGAPRFNESTGAPVWMRRPHDHEGFVGTTERWGAEATGAAGIVRAGVRTPRFHWVPGGDFDPRGCGV